MPGRQAKIIDASMLQQMLDWITTSSTPERDRVIILLSAKAGLRACEIARLQWSMILDPVGRIGSTMVVQDNIAKRGSGRRLPLHPDLQIALLALRDLTGSAGYVVRSRRGGAMRPNSIVNWFVTLFADLGYQGCSSHSGRRTFITLAARKAHHAGASLRDVQLLAGHRSLNVTQSYIDGDTDIQHRLVGLL